MMISWHENKRVNNLSYGFHFSLYHNMAKEKGTENILISPVVVASSLGMVALGGKASTASQVKTLLSADKLKDDQLHAGLSELLSEVGTIPVNPLDLMYVRLMMIYHQVSLCQRFISPVLKNIPYLVPSKYFSHVLLIHRWVMPKHATLPGRSTTASTAPAPFPSLMTLWRPARSTTTMTIRK